MGHRGFGRGTKVSRDTSTQKNNSSEKTGVTYIVSWTMGSEGSWRTVYDTDK